MPDVHDLAAGWRSGTGRSQLVALGVLMGLVAASFAVSSTAYTLVPLSTYFVWVLLGMLLLRFRPLVVLTVWTVSAAVAAVLLDGGFDTVRTSGCVALVLASTLVLYQSSLQRSGLPGPLGEAMLSDLRDRLQSQGTVPPLPEGWRCQTAMVAAHGVGYAGDFMVADLSEDEHHLELILVDVCGKGVAAGTAALQFAGALGGLIGALPPRAMLAAANDFLLRQESDETFATAAHVYVDLRTGCYSVLSAGHPPALRWTAGEGEWTVDNARGMALGILRRPDLEASEGVLGPGDALLFYTDGVVESRDVGLDEGIAWLRRAAASAVAPGFEGAARRILRQVERGDDDRAVLLLDRS
ncbi:PP2C family protein-serine/threonine phosphatase [Nocardioides kribbensis]|uniref:PP2C family protein-serine/threonine phosphatase n=1 Tax=Nocardioides kribbensis TaxID=305517 RepID=A0ABV1NUY2_9ACTN